MKKSKKPLKDTPEPERYAKIIAEQVSHDFKALNENLTLMKFELGEELREGDPSFHGNRGNLS